MLDEQGGKFLYALSLQNHRASLQYSTGCRICYMLTYMCSSFLSFSVSSLERLQYFNCNIRDIYLLETTLLYFLLEIGVYILC